MFIRALLKLIPCETFVAGGLILGYTYCVYNAASIESQKEHSDVVMMGDNGVLAPS